MVVNESSILNDVHIFAWIRNNDFSTTKFDFKNANDWWMVSTTHVLATMYQRYQFLICILLKKKLRNKPMYGITI